MPEPRRPYVYLNRHTQRWTTTCDPCSLTLSADHWATVLGDVTRHLTTTSHREAALADALARLDADREVTR